MGAVGAWSHVHVVAPGGPASAWYGGLPSSPLHVQRAASEQARAGLCSPAASFNSLT